MTTIDKRIFPGEHHQSAFDVVESEVNIRLSMESTDASVKVNIEGEVVERLPETSIFSSLPEASTYFEGGALGYSVTAEPQRLDGLMLATKDWRVEPLQVRRVYSSYFSDKGKFPEGALEFDHALIMRNVAHEWHSADDLYI